MQKFKNSKIFTAFLFIFFLFVLNIFGQNAQPAKCADNEDFDAQIAEANKGIEFGAYNVQALLKSGKAYYYKGNFDEALNDLQTVPATKSNENRAYYYIGAVYSSRTDYDRLIST